MRKVFLLSLALLFISVCAFAQYDSNANATSKSEAKTLQGCLSSSNGQFMLTDSSGNAHWLRGADKAQLQQSVGHQVQVTGRGQQVQAHSATGNQSSQTNAMSNNTDATQNSFQVQSIQDTGSACSSSGTQR